MTEAVKVLGVTTRDTAPYSVGDINELANVPE